LSKRKNSSKKERYSVLQKEENTERAKEKGRQWEKNWNTDMFRINSVGYRYSCDEAKNQQLIVDVFFFYLLAMNLPNKSTEWWQMWLDVTEQWKFKLQPITCYQEI